VYTPGPSAVPATALRAIQLWIGGAAAHHYVIGVFAYIMVRIACCRYGLFSCAAANHNVIGVFALKWCE
jgi:hypothetical protein